MNPDESLVPLQGIRPISVTPPPAGADTRVTIDTTRMSSEEVRRILMEHRQTLRELWLRRVRGGANGAR